MIVFNISLQGIDEKLQRDCHSYMTIIQSDVCEICLQKGIDLLIPK